MQTNGVRLTEATDAVLREHEVKCGVSVDGTRRDHDRHRKLKSGEAASPAVQNGLDRSAGRRTGRSTRGCCARCRRTPTRWRRSSNWPSSSRRSSTSCCHTRTEPGPGCRRAPRPRRTANGSSRPSTLVSRSATQPAPASGCSRTSSDGAGGSSGSEQIGLSPSATLVIETDGAIEQVDALKSAYEGAARTGLDVTRDEFDAAFDDPGVAARQIGLRALCDTCLRCRIHPVCGGGHYAHRYRPGNGFRQPSVYCADITNGSTTRPPADRRGNRAARREGRHPMMRRHMTWTRPPLSGSPAGSGRGRRRGVRALSDRPSSASISC